MLVRLLNSLLLGLLLMSCASLPLYAWNDPGHRAIAIAALRLLPPETQRVVLTTLAAHPRYKQDIKKLQPRELGDFTAGEWQIGQAATWPDIARGFEHAWFWQRDGLRTRYHRGRWHYINFPIYLNPADQQLQIADPTQGCRDGRCAEPSNVLQALTFFERAFADPATTLTQRGLWLAWALHLLGDAHQPLHSTALFDTEHWPRGDRGGNDVLVGDELNLHAYWDRALLETGGAKEIALLVDELMDGRADGALDGRADGALDGRADGTKDGRADQPLADLPDALGFQIHRGSLNQRVDVEALLRESHQVAGEAVYGPLLGQLRTAGSPVELDATYHAQAKGAARQQGKRAAWRTAQWLQTIFGATATP